MRKSASVVRITGSASVSVRRTRQASARLMGTSVYFCMSFSTGSRSFASSKATSKERRRRSALRPGVPRAPSRWKASDKAASHVVQGGACCGADVTAHWWWVSRRLSSATTKPASTRTFPAIAGGAQITPLLRTQVGRQAIHRSDEIGDGVECCRPAPFRSGYELQPFANDVRLRDLASTRFRLDICDKGLRQAHG